MSRRPPYSPPPLTDGSLPRPRSFASTEARADSAPSSVGPPPRPDKRRQTTSTPAATSTTDASATSTPSAISRNGRPRPGIASSRSSPRTSSRRPTRRVAEVGPRKLRLTSTWRSTGRMLRSASMRSRSPCRRLLGRGRWGLRHLLGQTPRSLRFGWARKRRR